MSTSALERYREDWRYEKSGVPGVWIRRGHFEIHYRDVDGKTRWERCGQDLDRAIARKVQLLAEVNKERRRLRREGHRQVERARQAKLAENRQNASEALSLIVRAAQACQRVSDASESGGLRIASRASLGWLYEAEDSLKRAIYSNHGS